MGCPQPTRRFRVTDHVGGRFTGKQHGSLGKAVSVFHRLGERVDLSRRRARHPREASSAAVEQQGYRVTTSPSSRRTTVTGAALLALALGVTACGSDDPKVTDDPSETVSTSTSPTPTPTPTETPLSPFEDKAPVKALRAWTTAAAKAVNDHERSLASVRPLVTDQGMTMTEYFTKDDLEHGYQLPGPQPFTPVSVRTRGATATLNVCLQNKGWSVDPKTGKTVNKRKVSAAVFELRKVGGAWKFDRYYAGTADCAGVTVQGVQW
jgi:hypothetical protein